MACFNCGECCREQKFTLTEQEFQLIFRKTRRQLRHLVIAPNRLKTIEPCPFWKGKCLIYPIRPTQCRLFHCGRLKQSDPKIETMSGLRLMMSENPEYAKWREAMEYEAIRWGNHHGWDWRRSESWQQHIGSTTLRSQLARHQLHRV